MNIHCPGDIVYYRCIITTNSESPQLTWVITLPERTPLSITYRGASSCSSVDRLNDFISTSIDNFTGDSLIESTLTMELQTSSIVNQTQLTCFIADLGHANHTVFINASGKFSSAEDAVSAVHQ